MRSTRFLPFVLVLTTVGLLSGSAGAADLYGSIRAGFSSANAEGSGTNALVGPSVSGDDDDASPVYGGALGVAVPLSDVVPWSLRIPSFDIPYWPGRSIHVSGTEDFRFPGWRTLIEAEALTGRDFRFSTPGSSSLTPYNSDVTSTSLMGNVRLDVPVQAPMTALFGRLPMLEPLTLYAGGGAGMGWNEIETSDTVNSGSDESFDLAYQFMAGVGYALSDTTHLSIGWRFYDLGEVETDLDGGPNPGNFSADVSAHEFTTSLRFHFYHVPFFGRE
ncbi:MAG: outer membrane protein [Myxococcota bacterium]